ncbi:phage portal protein [Staphylococcus kloosii]|uniref:phage portal protein n=1 Tax=Staphylococcus kloosii TaxID=29384 RepID=UPI000D1F851F|nr:phage portal protein [Staphylococcus kloosii]PTJ79258.1 phage portal protein [Staphylococcus kloosii]
MFDKIMGRNEAIDFSFDFDLLRETSHKAYIKRWALDTCINHMARTISQTKFEIQDNNTSDYTSTTYYKLNVRPNTDESAATFWQKVTRKLVMDNEVLIIVTDTKDLIIADDFEREEFALYDDKFKNVVIGDYKFERNYLMSEVIYLEYSNAPISNLLEGLFKDYGDIFGRLINANLMNNQIRATLDMDANTALNKDTQKNMQDFINKAYDSFATNDIAIVPVQKGFEYKEYTSTNSNKSISNVDELTKAPNALLRYVATQLGIPFPLLDGSVADIEAMTENYMKFCINPLLEKIIDELNAKLISERSYKEGKRIKSISIDQKGPVDVSEAIDKLIASGAFTRNEVRQMVGYEKSDDQNMDEFVITKNYQSVDTPNTVQGGDDNEQTIL